MCTEVYVNRGFFIGVSNLFKNSPFSFAGISGMSGTSVMPDISTISAIAGMVGLADLASMIGQGCTLTVGFITAILSRRTHSGE